MKLYDILQKKHPPTGGKKDSYVEEYIAPQKKSLVSYISFWGGIVVILVLVYFIGVINTRAHVTISERKIPFSLTDEHFTLVHESKSQAGDIPFQIVKVVDQSARQVIGTQAPFTNKAPTQQTIKKTIIVKGKKKTITTVVPIIPVPTKVFSYQLPDDQKDSIVNMLNADLFERLKRETRTQIPDNLLLSPDLQFFFFDKNSINFTGTDVAFPVVAHGTMTSYLINKEILEQAIASVVLRGDTTYPEVSILEIGNLQIKPISAPPADPNTIPNEFTISITGQGTLITKVLPSDIQSSLVGVGRSSFDSILAKYKEIDTGSFSMYPFWATSFPTKKERILVKVD